MPSDRAVWRSPGFILTLRCGLSDFFPAEAGRLLAFLLPLQSISKVNMPREFNLIEEGVDAVSVGDYWDYLRV